MSENDSAKIREMVLTKAAKAKAAFPLMARASAKAKNDALLAMADLLEKEKGKVMAANEKDVEKAKADNLDAPLVDRLVLNEDRVAQMVKGLREIAALPDPVGEMDGFHKRPSGITVGKMRVPIGVIGIIYESRPNVTVDAASLCLKSGNACVLRGGSESFNSNLAIADIIARGLEAAGLPADAVQFLDTTSRDAVGALITADKFVDVIIPRGGKGLIQRITDEAKVPVIKHLDGICHCYVDVGADMQKSLKVAINAKTHRYGTCNTMETLLVHEKAAPEFLPLFAEAMAQKGVEIRACEKSLAHLPDGTKKAEPEDWDTEYLAPIISVKTVADIDEAIAHINEHGSHHTDSILTENHPRAMRFLREVDSSSVMVNASTRFADGYEYGLGAEIGISTNKLHARGPVGLDGLTTLKWVVLGDGEIRI